MERERRKKNEENEIFFPKEIFYDQLNVFGDFFFVVVVFSFKNVIKTSNLLLLLLLSRRTVRRVRRQRRFQKPVDGRRTGRNEIGFLKVSSEFWSSLINF